MVLLYLAGLNQPVLGIWLVFLAAWHPQLLYIQLNSTAKLKVHYNMFCISFESVRPKTPVQGIMLWHAQSPHTVSSSPNRELVPGVRQTELCMHERWLQFQVNK